MKRLRFYTGTTGMLITIPGGQILSLSIIADPNTGTWFRVNESKAIWVPAGAVIDLTAEEFGACLCETARADQYPGDVSIQVGFAGLGPDGVLVPNVAPPDDTRVYLAPASWLIVVNDDC